MISYSEVYNKLSKKLYSSRFLQKWDIDKNIIWNFFEDKKAKQNILNILDKKDFSPSKILDLCYSPMKAINKDLSENPLMEIYQYTLSKTFKDACTLKVAKDLYAPFELYLRVFRVFCEIQKTVPSDSFESKFPLNFLSPLEEEELEHKDEYLKFVKAFKHNYIYEMMELSKEVLGYNTIEHISGVHYLSMYIARQLKNLLFPIDLGRVSGASAGHDIGKYGCIGEELKRVPYLHYYYSDEWFKRYGINYIRHIAINHSTWDLEFENLSLESLILIYADFRVKNKNVENNPTMNIFTLNDSFAVILEKLDNVDDDKEKRYKKVYAKLLDFENFLKFNGIDTEVHSQFSNIERPLQKSIKKNYALLFGNEITENLKFLSIYHNVNLMYKLRDEYSLDAILEEARSEKNWRNFREYIRVFEEYSTYLTQKQKLQTIKFLFDNLVHPEDDIRRHSAALIGNLIAIFDEKYRKEIPKNVVLTSDIITGPQLFKEYLDMLLYPSHKIIPYHRFLLSYNLSIMVDSLFKNCNEDSKEVFKEVLLEEYENVSKLSKDSSLFLLQTSEYIPLTNLGDNLKPMFTFISNALEKKNNMLRVAGLEASLNISKCLPKDHYFRLAILEHLKARDFRSTLPPENLLKARLWKVLEQEDESRKFYDYVLIDENKMPDIFLSNLKTATDFIKKKTQIDFICYNASLKPKSFGLHSAIHFCNLLKVSAIESVRSHAGNAIIKVLPYLNQPERNEVAVELLRALEIEGNRFTEYIPAYLGKVILYLKPEELDEALDDLNYKIKTANEKVKCLMLKTIGVCIQNYTFYEGRFKEEKEKYDNRLCFMLGILLNGTADYNKNVMQAALSVIGKDIFHSEILSMKNKADIYIKISKKLLTLVRYENQENLLFLSNSSSLNYIYKFISNYSFLYDDIVIETPEKLAFFPGTFDPFSNSHKAIVTLIRNMGFEVYLAIDEFSWSKKTLPSLLRKNIVNMSIAEDLHVYVYPDNYPTNIANSLDLKKLKENFPCKRVYMVAGMDVIMNASCYKKEVSEDSIHNFPHIVFERGSSKKLQALKSIIKEEVLLLSLPAKYNDISSTQIRRFIDENRDISSLVSPMAQNYINENGFYQREPQEKTLPKSLFLKSEIIDDIDNNLLQKLFSCAGLNIEKHKDFIKDFSKMPSARAMILMDTNENKILGFSLFHWLRSNNLYEELKSGEVSEYFRDHSTGRVMVIDDIYVNAEVKNLNITCIVITETLAFSISRDYEYCIYKSSTKALENEALLNYLKLQGFIKVPKTSENENIYAVSMSTPCILNLDLENSIKEPFRSNISIRNEISKAREKLMGALCSLYKGQLLLSFDTTMLHQSMIRKICEVNEVLPLNEGTLGNAMCVPYGDILDRYIIPNTVTKAIHTEKYFNGDMSGFKIAEFPHYMDLYTQVKMLKSFNRPVILVDNILHKGYRMQALNPLFKEEEVEVKTVVAGILSGKGKDLMSMQNRSVSSVYFIPRLRTWFNENALYPFIGGDAVLRTRMPERNLVPSINLILPYTSPTFIRDATVDSIYDLSKICIENSINILQAMEEEYHYLHERNLSLLSLGQIFNTPRCTDPGSNLDFNLNLSPSSYLINDLERLVRLKYILK